MWVCVVCRWVSGCAHEGVCVCVMIWGMISSVCVGGGIHEVYAALCVGGVHAFTCIVCLFGLFGVF